MNDCCLTCLLFVVFLLALAGWLLDRYSDKPGRYWTDDK